MKKLFTRNRIILLHCIVMGALLGLVYIDLASTSPDPERGFQLIASASVVGLSALFQVYKSDNS